jgi:hypothetical protein
MKLTKPLTPPILQAALALVALALPLGAQAQPQSDIERARDAMSKLIATLTEQGMLPKDKAEALARDVAPPPRPVAANGARPAEPVRVGYVPQFVRDEIKRELRAELVDQAAREGWAGPNAVPAWTRGMVIDGDVRVRLQTDRFDDGNAPAISVGETNRNRAATAANTTEDRERLRVRARVGVTATLDENWAAGVRLTTGSLTDPISSNQTLGNNGNRFTLALDRAYVRWQAGGAASVIAGRFGNPWFGTDLVWANDLGFDGIAAQWTPTLGSLGRGFLTVAAMPVQEVELSTADKWLFGIQLGAESNRLFGRVAGKFGIGYYHYDKLAGRASPAGSSVNEFTAPAFAQKGNTYFNISSDPNRPLLGLASDFELINVTGSLSLPIGSWRLALTADYVKNLGFERAEVAARTGFDVRPQVEGWLLRSAFGSAEIARRGDWQVFGGYKRLERDAVPDAFTDGDLRLGGTDTKGWFFGASVGLGKNTGLTLRMLSGDAISGPPLSVDTVHLDLNVRY